MTEKTTLSEAASNELKTLVLNPTRPYNSLPGTIAFLGNKTQMAVLERRGYIEIVMSWMKRYHVKLTEAGTQYAIEQGWIVVETAPATEAQPAPESALTAPAFAVGDTVQHDDGEQYVGTVTRIVGEFCFVDSDGVELIKRMTKVKLIKRADPTTPALPTADSEEAASDCDYCGNPSLTLIDGLCHICRHNGILPIDGVYLSAPNDEITSTPAPTAIETPKTENGSLPNIDEQNPEILWARIRALEVENNKLQSHLDSAPFASRVFELDKLQADLAAAESKIAGLRGALETVIAPYLLKVQIERWDAKGVHLDTAVYGYNDVVVTREDILKAQQILNAK